MRSTQNHRLIFDIYIIFSQGSAQLEMHQRGSIEGATSGGIIPELGRGKHNVLQKHLGRQVWGTVQKDSHDTYLKSEAYALSGTAPFYGVKQILVLALTHPFTPHPEVVGL